MEALAKNIVEELLDFDQEIIARPYKEFPLELKKLGGKTFVFPLQALEVETACKIKDKALRMLVDDGGMEMEMLSYETALATVTLGCPEVFQNERVLSHFGVKTGKDLINKILTPGELDTLKTEIDALGSYDRPGDEEAKEEVKNS